MTKNPFLKRAYRLKNQQDTLSMYGEWATAYDHTLENPDYLQACHGAVKDGIAITLEDHDGPHMVKLGMTSKIMVLQNS